MSGCVGSSANVARQVRPVSSGHETVTEPSARVTSIGPARTPVRSSAIGTAGVCEEKSANETMSVSHASIIGADYRAKTRALESRSVDLAERLW